MGIPLPRHTSAGAEFYFDPWRPRGEREFHHNWSAPRYRRPAHAAPGPRRDAGLSGSDGPWGCWNISSFAPCNTRLRRSVLSRIFQPALTPLLEAQWYGG